MSNEMPNHWRARTLTELDHVRLGRLVHLRRHAGIDDVAVRAVGEALDDAMLVPSKKVEPDVVTMNSQLLLREAASGERRKFAVCYPEDAEPQAGFVSVLSPLGASVVGLRVGDTAVWRTPAGGEQAGEVVAILFQPEASGDYTL